ncbi:MAG: AAA family ATPase [Enterococcus sp.]|nr:AAA family ATPase [Enterococcus sp.]
MSPIELIALSGISGSGKTTWANAWAAEDPQNRVRVNQDDIRTQLFTTPDYSKEQEKLVRKHLRELILSSLKEGKSVVSDNTNLGAGKLQHLHDIARHLGVGFRVHRLHATVEEATININQRVQEGGLGVSLGIIKSQHKAFLKSIEAEFQSCGSKTFLLD